MSRVELQQEDRNQLRYSKHSVSPHLVHAKPDAAIFFDGLCPALDLLLRRLNDYVPCIEFACLSAYPKLALRLTTYIRRGYDMWACNHPSSLGVPNCGT